MRKIFLISIYLLFSHISNGQIDASIIAKYQFDGNEMKIRWSYADYPTWKSAVKNGLTIILSELDSNLIIHKTQVISENIKPKSIKDLKQEFGPNNKYAAIAAQMLYGKSTISSSDNFGEFIRLKKMEQEQQFASLNFAISMDYQVALSFGFAKTISVEKNKSYILKFVFKNIENKYDTNYLFLNTFDIYKKTKAPEISTSSEEHSVKINWQLNENEFIAYHIEKAETNTTNFTKINNEPLFYLENEYTVEGELNLIDSLTENYIPYQYRLLAIDFFGNISEPSEIKIGQGVDKTPPPIVKNIKLKIIPNEKITINWKEYKGSLDLIGFNLLKSNNALGPFLKVNDNLIDKNQLYYEDLNPFSPQTNYYIVEAIDTASNAIQSISVAGIFYDTLPPICPEVVSQNSMKEYTIDLRWKKPIDKDIYGYKVYFANQEDHIFTTKNGFLISDTFYIDTPSLRTLTKYAFYKITAFDYSFNESNNCPIFKVLRKDTISPLSVNNFMVINQDSVFKISWKHSSSADAEKISIQKKIKNKNNWLPIFEGLNAIDSVFYDPKIEPDKEYEYKIILYDNSGNSQETRVINAKTNKKFAEIEHINNLQVSKIENTYKLSWNKELKVNESVLVYLIDSTDQSTILIGKSTHNEFTLPNYYAKSENSFCVIVLNMQGDKSKKSNIIKIE